LEPKVADPASSALLRRGWRFTLAYLKLGGAPLVKAINWGTELPAHASQLAPVLADPELFPHLPKMEQDMVVANVLDFATKHPSFLASIDALLESGGLDARQAERYLQRVRELRLADVVAADVHPSRYAQRIIEELKKHDWYAQNPAIAALRNAGPERVSRLSAEMQHALGNNVLQAADGGSWQASELLHEIVRREKVWPSDFVAGVVAECFVNDSGVVRFKTSRMHDALLTLATVAEEARDYILATLVLSISNGGVAAPSRNRSSFDEVLETIDGLTDIELRDSTPMQRVRRALTDLLGREVSEEDERELPSF
jgi:hypothetical protein